MELKVLILDDEYIILDGLCSFEWESYGCRVAASAGDGSEGLELVRKYRPDIILSDIKMPGMDGLEFSAEVKKLYPDTEIILLTGYDDFAFAQKALHIGVAEYLLKPVNFKEMDEVIQRVCNHIFARQKKNKDYIELREKYRRALPALRSKLISDMIFGRMKERGEIDAMIKRLDIKIHQYILVYGKLSEHEKNNDLEPGLLDFIVCNISEEIFRRDSIRVYSEIDTLGYCFVVIYPESWAGADCSNQCMEACEKIRNSLKTVIQCKSSFGISNPCRNAADMNVAFEQAQAACEESLFLDENGAVIQYSDIEGEQLITWNITEGERKRIMFEVIRGNTETVKRIIDQVFANCNDIEEMRYAVMELLVRCFECIAHKSDVFRKSAESKTMFMDTMEKISACHSRRELLDSMKKLLSYMGTENKGAQLNRNQKTAEDIMNYITQNYAGDISLDVLADYFRISKTYINRLLKKNTRKSFLENLMDIRLTKAEQLIAENRYKIYEVAEKVGYHDLSYFIRVFKKKYGVTPNVYRRI